MGRILIVEDEQILGEVWGELLRARGHEVEVFRAGGPALDSIERLAPDLAIVDLTLPDMDGLDLIAEARQLNSGARLPVLVVSGCQEEATMNSAFAAGANDFLVKPLGSSELLAKTAILLKQSSRFARMTLSADYLPGQVAFGRFLIEGMLGEGSFGAVYSAACLKTGEPVALKVLTSEAPVDQHRFLRECYTLASLSHPGVAGVVDYGCEEGTYYLAMERIEGADLASEVRKDGSYSEDAVLGALCALGNVLAELEAKGVLHRDIKPANVILREGDILQPILVDFGLAKRTLESGLTSPNMMLGTPGYMAPEIMVGQELDCRSDLFSVGMLARYLLTGADPYPSLDALSLLQRMVRDPMPMQIGVSELTEQLLCDLTARNPEERVQSGVELVSRAVEALEALHANQMAEVAAFALS